MMDQLFIYVFDVLIFLSDNLEVILGAFIVVVGAALLVFVVKKTKEEKLLRLEVAKKRSQQSRQKKNSTPYKALQPIASKNPKMPPIHVENSAVEDNCYDAKEMQRFVIQFLSEVAKEPAYFKRINPYVWSCVTGKKGKKKISKKFEIALRQELDNLNAQGVLIYNKNNQTWKFNPKKKLKEKPKNKSKLGVKLHALTAEEVGYFSNQGLGTGWYRLNSKTSGMDAMWWIHENFNWAEFERFCCAILAHHNFKGVGVSEKRPSGADDGIDGFGCYELDGKIVDVAMQAKRYRPDRYVTTAELRDFIGALVEHDIDYGIFITTGEISDRAKIRAKETMENSRNNINLQLLDQGELMECMEYRANSLHGLGLHKADDLGFYYLNPEMLKKSIAEYK